MLLAAVVLAALAVVWQARPPGPPVEEGAAPSPPGRTGDAVSVALPEGDGTRIDATTVPGVACDGDGEDDLQAALDLAEEEEATLVIPAGARCRLDTTLEVPSGARIDASGAVVEGQPGAFRPRPERESLVQVAEVADVTINGGVWRMAEDEGANVFDIRSSSDVRLTALTAVGAREDGVYIGRDTSERVTLRRILAHRNGRSGISITTGRDITVQDSQARDNGHILDMRGLTIEPNSDGGALSGIRIVDLETTGNVRSGASVSLRHLDDDDEEVDIVFERYRSFDEPVGLRVSSGLAGGEVRVVDAQFHRTRGVALQMEDRWASAFRVDVVRPVIRDWGTDPSGRPQDDSAISLYTAEDDVDEPLGGVRIVEPTIVAHPDAGRHAYYLYVGDDRDEPVSVQDTAIVNPRVLRNGRGLSIEGDVHVGWRPQSRERPWHDEEPGG